MRQAKEEADRANSAKSDSAAKRHESLWDKRGAWLFQCRLFHKGVQRDNWRFPCTI